MILRSFKFGLAALFALGLVFNAAAQEVTVTKKTEVVQNPDGSYTVIEYPVGKEVTVSLNPFTTVTGSTGTARVLRAADGTKVWVDLTGVPSTTTSMYAYAVDPTGVPTLLGPISITNGIAKAEFATPMNQFMLVVSPNEGLTAIDTATPVFYRSSLPNGFAVVPRRVSENRVVAVAPSVVSREPLGYEVPLLNLSTFGDDEREVKMKFTGELDGLEAKAYVKRGKGSTKVRMHFDDMNKVPKGKQFTLWTYSPDGQYTKLGQVINSGKKDEAAIKSETSLTDFGLFVTAEDAAVTIPTSRIYSVFTYTPPKQ
ncbi:MAG TPA: hypothetical protein VNA22_07735 [Pyrinomonadaceae bacterium]|nr:hypothetical protein [Pyrinomonadaceae bacterium]